MNRSKIGTVLYTSSFSVVFGVLFAVSVHVIIPWLLEITDITPFIVTQVVTTLMVFMPVFSTTILLMRKDGLQLDWKSVKERLGFRRISIKDLIWMTSALIVAAALIVLIIQIVHWLPFLKDVPLDSLAPYELRPLVGCELFFILFMFVSFFFNYVGEEILWRGYLYPIQEEVLGRLTWVLNGILHAVFHLYMGWSVLAFTPIFFAIALVYKKTRNVSVVIVMHLLLGAPTDFLLALGVIH
jgi:membrane protease YdiL (CAAX protease family)